MNKEDSIVMTKDLIERAYSCACSHGFHEVELSVEHYLMLVLSEIGEAVEAHRRGLYHFANDFHPKMESEEEWRTISCCEDYEVSNLGRVRSKDMRVWNGKVFYTKIGKDLSSGIGGTGYKTVSLRGRTHKVALLVANAFLKKKTSTDVVNHIDGNKLNDNVGNLEWVSLSDNSKHAVLSGLVDVEKKRKLPYWDRVYIAFERKKGRRYTSILKDKEFGITRSGIQNICREYKKYTDSVEFELSDVCIRLYDMCGALGIEPMVEYDTMEMDFKEIFGEDTFCERMYYLSRLLCSTSGVMEDDGTDECLPQVVGQALSFLFALSKDMKVDLVQHIEWKMRYNEERPYKNGKKY